MPDPAVPHEYFPKSSTSIFWIDTDKIVPNPFQPRKEFHEAALRDLADSIRQYGVLQPLVVTRREEQREDGSLVSVYELIAGERRLRASKLAGVQQVPAIIRMGEDSDKTKLEIAIIENVQREELNVVERARAFMRLAEEFGYKHLEIAKKVGKSREYVANSVRILNLPESMVEALNMGRITEGHTRPLLMLSDRPDEQMTLFKDIVLKIMSVREAELQARKIAYERVRKNDPLLNPIYVEMEEKLTEKLGTKVSIVKKPRGANGVGRLVIDFFTPDELHNLLDLVNQGFAAKFKFHDPVRATESRLTLSPEEQAEVDRLAQEDDVQQKPEDDSMYSVTNFSL